MRPNGNEPTFSSVSDTEAALVADLAAESHRFGSKETLEDGGVEVRVDVLRTEGGRERVTVHSFEEYAAQPHRERGTATVHDVDSFATLLGFHSDAVVFADEQRARLTAVLNFHGWRDHTIVLQLAKSEQLNRWLAVNSKFMHQAAFVEFIQDNLADILDPTAADMLEVAQSFQAARDVEFDSRVQLDSGAVRFAYRETVQARAGRAGELEVPSTFVLGVPIWRGGQRIELKAQLRYRVQQEGLSLGFKVLALEDVVRDAFEGVVAAVVEKLDADAAHKVVNGPAPDPVVARQ